MGITIVILLLVIILMLAGMGLGQIVLWGISLAVALFFVWAALTAEPRSNEKKKQQNAPKPIKRREMTPQEREQYMDDWHSY